MANHFTASRISGDGNSVFPDELIIDSYEQSVFFRKGQIIGHKEMRINFSAIGSVSRNVHLLFADIIIETTGGMTICAKGFTRSDAEEIVELLTPPYYQSRRKKYFNY